jgi:hypothetical protein
VSLLQDFSEPSLSCCALHSPAGDQGVVTHAKVIRKHSFLDYDRALCRFGVVRHTFWKVLV